MVIAHFVYTCMLACTCSAVCIFAWIPSIRHTSHVCILVAPTYTQRYNNNRNVMFLHSRMSVCANMMFICKKYAMYPRHSKLKGAVHGRSNKKLLLILVRTWSQIYIQDTREWYPLRILKFLARFSLLVSVQLHVRTCPAVCTYLA